MGGRGRGALGRLGYVRSGMQAGCAMTGKGRGCRQHRGFQNEASSVRKDLEARVCVLEKQQVTLLAWKVQTFNKEAQGR